MRSTLKVSAVRARLGCVDECCGEEAVGPIPRRSGRSRRQTEWTSGYVKGGWLADQLDRLEAGSGRLAVCVWVTGGDMTRGAVAHAAAARYSWISPPSTSRRRMSEDG